MNNLLKIKELMLSQDNRATENPIFVVFQKERKYGLNTDYSDNSVYVKHYFDGSLIEIENNSDDIDSDEFKVEEVGYIDVDVFVSCFFTENAAQDYILKNKHNLNEPYIYVESAHRNFEWQSIRNHILSLECE